MGYFVGKGVGYLVGNGVGYLVGKGVGLFVGSSEGDHVGSSVGSSVSNLHMVYAKQLSPEGHSFSDPDGQWSVHLPLASS